MVSSKQALVGVGLVGALAFLSTRTSAEPIGEVMGCTNDKADNYNPKASQDDGSCKFTLIPIEDLIPDNLSDDSVWKSDGLVVRLEHPLAATNDKYKKYYFEAKLVVDVMQSGAYKTWAEVPETFTGDYSWELRRYGGGLDKWTQESNAEDMRGSLSKTLLSSSVDGIKPTFDSVLNAFGGYVPNYPAVNMGQVQIQSGSLTETGGSYRYVNSKGTKVSKQQIVLDLSGNQISPEPIQMQVKCSGQSWKNVGSSVVVIGSLIAENENKSVKFFPADAISGSLPGLSYGCTIPIVAKTLPNSIRVVDSAGTQVSIDDLVPSVNTTVSVENIQSVSAKGYINTTLFSSFGFPQVQKDGGGYFIMWGIPNRDKKAYISELIPGFNALYQRRQVQCQCPNGTVNAGQTVTVYDTNNCPSWTTFISNGDKNEYCGGEATPPEPVDKGECICTTNQFTGQTSCKYENVDENCTLEQAPSQGENNEGSTDGISGPIRGNVSLSMAEQNLILNAESIINSGQSFIHY